MNNAYQLTILAAAYNESTYGCGEYDESGNCTRTTNTTTTTTQDTGPLAPLTGFFQQPPQIVLPTLLLIAVLLGAVSFLIAKALKRSPKA